MPDVSIADLSHHAGQQVTVRGWVTTTRSSGKIAFLVLRDGSGYLQAVFPKNEIVEGAWVGSSRVDLQACKLEYSIVSPK